MDNPFGTGRSSNPFDKGDRTVHEPEPPFEVEKSKSNLPNEVVKTVKDPRAEERAAEIAKRRKALDEKLAENRNKKQEILEEHGGLESNIPINSEYWELKG